MQGDVDDEDEAEARDAHEDWVQRVASQPIQAARVGSSREATPLDSSAYPGSEAADGDWQQDEDELEDDDEEDDNDEDYA